MLREIGGLECALQKMGAFGRSINGRDHGCLRNISASEPGDPNRSDMVPVVPSRKTSPSGEFDHEALITEPRPRGPRCHQMAIQRKCEDLCRRPSALPRSGSPNGSRFDSSRR